MYPSLLITTPDPSPRCLGSCGFTLPLPLPRFPPLNSSPKNRRKNGSSNICGELNEAFLGVELMKTFTTLGATFFTTGAKLVVSFVSRFSGLLSTSILGGSALLVPFPWANGLRPSATAPMARAPLRKRADILHAALLFVIGSRAGLFITASTCRRRLTPSFPAHYIFVTRTGANGAFMPLEDGKAGRSKNGSGPRLQKKNSSLERVRPPLQPFLQMCPLLSQYRFENVFNG